MRTYSDYRLRPADDMCLWVSTSSELVHGRHLGAIFHGSGDYYSSEEDSKCKSSTREITSQILRTPLVINDSN